MSWATAAVIGAIASVIGGFGLWLWSLAEERGRVKERNSILEAELEQAKKVRDLQAQPDVSWSEFVGRLRAKTDGDNRV